MSDIFRIKDVDIKLEFQGKQYAFVDPSYPKKVSLRKKSAEARKRLEAGQLEMDDFMLEVYEINKEMIRLHLPEMPKEMIDELGEHKVLALLESLTEFAKDNFGAVVKKIEDTEKKS